MLRESYIALKGNELEKANPLKTMTGHFCAATVLFMSATSAMGVPPAQDAPDCYDAIVKARVVYQVPSVVPDCGPDCIIMVWPWFLDLNVSKVVEGTASQGQLQTQIMLHKFFRRDHATRKWWLRRNTLGSFNVLRSGNEGIKQRCANDAKPAKAYLEPGPDKTLAELRAEGERAYRAYQ